MQFPINLRSEKSACSLSASRFFPAIDKCLESSPLALSTWPVPCRQRHGFIEEEEFGVESWRHHLPVPAFEFQETGNPPMTHELADDFPTAIVQRPSPISHKGSARRSGEDRSVRVHAVLQQHPEGSVPHVLMPQPS